MRRFPISRLVVYIGLISVFTVESQAKEGFSINSGVPIHSRDEGFRKLESNYSAAFPLKLPISKSAVLSTGWNAGMGALWRADESAYMAYIGPVITLSVLDDKIKSTIGTSAAIMSRSRFGTKDLGSNGQFVTTLSLGYSINRRLSLLSGFQHISNADLGTPNPGLEFINISVQVYPFDLE
jgi:hypothetical protein